jgi:hypothetical protein
MAYCAGEIGRFVIALEGARRHDLASTTSHSPARSAQRGASPTSRFTPAPARWSG